MNLRALGSLTLLLGLLLAAPESAWADTASAETPDTEEARTHFSQGLKLYKDGDFDAALVQFERAYAIKPNYKVLYNIGQTYFQLREYVEARDAISRYLREGGTAIDAERQAAATKDLADLERRVAKVTVSVNVNGATVLVDGKKVGVTPLSGPISVSEGQRTISVETGSRGTRQRLLRVAGGEEQSLKLDFEEAPHTVVLKPSNGAEPAQSSGGPGVGVWVGIVGAAVLGAGAGVTGILALSAEKDNQNQQKQFGVTASTLDDSRTKAKTLALTTDILAGAAIVCAGVAVVLWSTAPSHQESAQLGLNVGPTSASLFGRF